MANYVSPMDLIAPYLTPLAANVNQGIDTGVKLVNLQNSIDKERMMRPYYEQLVSASKANEARTEALTTRTTADEARKARVSAAYENLFAPTPEMKNVYPEYQQPVDTAPHEEGPLSPSELSAVSAVAAPTSVPTGATVPSLPSLQQMLAVPGQTVEERQKILGLIETGRRNEETLANREAIQGLRNDMTLRTVADKIASAEKIAELRNTASGVSASERQSKAYEQTELKIKNNAMREAAKRTSLRFGSGSGMSISTDASGNVSITNSGGGSPEALDYFNTELQKNINAGLFDAIKKGRLPKEYAPETLPVLPAPRVPATLQGMDKLLPNTAITPGTQAGNSPPPNGMSETSVDRTISYGNRTDGTPKGTGYFGELQRPDGKVSTELSLGVNFDGKDVLIPALVPTLTKSEVDYLLSGKQPTKAIIDKAVAHARQRLTAGKSPFAAPEDQIMFESDARAKMKARGLKPAEIDTWIRTYKEKGKVK